MLVGENARLVAVTGADQDPTQQHEAQAEDLLPWPHEKTSFQQHRLRTQAT